MMSHLTDEVISDLIDGRADVAVEAGALVHFGECEECRDIRNRVAFVVSSAIDLRRRAYPREELWPSIAAATVGPPRRRAVAITLIAIIAIMSTLLAVALIVGQLPVREQGRLAVIALPSAEASKMSSALGEIARLKSDDDKRTALDELSGAVLRRYGSQVRREFFAAANTIGSNGERRRLILSIADIAPSDAGLTAMMIECARSIQSSHDRAVALSRIAGDRTIKTVALRDLFVGAAGSIVSTVDRDQAMAALRSHSR